MLFCHHQSKSLQFDLQNLDSIQNYISQAMSYVDDFIQRLNQISPEIKALLQQIRAADLKSEKLQVALEEERINFLHNLKISGNKRQASYKKQLQKKYKSILQSDKLLLKYSRDKVQLAERLYNFIHQPTQKLDKQLHLRGQKYAKVDLQIKGKKGKKKGRPNKQEWENDPNEPKYCYCGKPSYGQMVMCENTYCQKQWFHRQCIDEKKLPEKWFCRECRQKK